MALRNNRPSPDPTPEEIRMECERIREGWTEQVHRQRAGCHAAQPVEMQIVGAKLTRRQQRFMDRQDGQERGGR